MPSRLKVALSIAAFALWPTIVLADTAQFVSSYTWPAQTKDHGGFSGIEVSDDGKRFTVIGDRGAIVEGVFIRENQVIRGVKSTLRKIKNRQNMPLSKRQSDAEGLAIHSDGRVYISFEHRHRVWDYQQIDSIAQKLPKHRDFKRFSGNDGLEALAIAPDGTLYALPEKTTKSGLKIYRYRDGKWKIPFRIPATKGFKPVGADFGPDGRFYLLERNFKGVFGFENRVRRFDISGNNISRGEVVLQTPAGRHGNLEGIALWRDAGGNIRLTLVADDNFNYFQRSEFVEYRLQE